MRKWFPDDTDTLASTALGGAHFDTPPNWYIGDWLGACKGEAWGYGDLEETCQRFDLNYQTAANAKSVCDNFLFSRRRENLTFSHHQEVQGRASVIKIKAKIGELLPAKSPKQTGAMKGKKGTTADVVPFPQTTIAAYRKMAKHVDKIDDYYFQVA